MSADKQVDYVGAMVTLAKVAGEVPMSADTGAVDAAERDWTIIDEVVKELVFARSMWPPENNFDDFWADWSERETGKLRSYRESAERAIAAFQRAQAARVTALVENFEASSEAMGVLYAKTDLNCLEASTPKQKRAWNATYKQQQDDKTALLKAVVGEVEG